MVRRTNRLPFFILAGAILMLVIGCSQTEDVVTPVTTTEISLTAERLPSLPPTMSYELWITSLDGDTVSLGKFLYNGATMRFLDMDSTARTNVFTFDDDLLRQVKTGSTVQYKYNSMFVSVETIPDNNAAPGPIMLVDRVSEPTDDPVELRFPLSDSLWKSYVRFNLEGVTDGNRQLGDGDGLWFSRYLLETYDVPDTTGVDLEWESFTAPDNKPDTFLCDMVDIVVDTVPVVLEPTEIYLRTTPLVHTGINWRFVTCIDSEPPIQYDQVKPTFQTRLRRDTLEWFTQDAYNLPDYTQWGWKYKGWVVLQHYNTVPMTTRWRMTPPAYRYKSAGNNFIPGDNGVLFTTGSFSRIDGPDDGNPYVGPGKVPPFPGEDFFNSTALQRDFGLDAVHLMADSVGNVGTVFISLEPLNSPFDTTNFPLLAFVKPLPANRSSISPPRVPAGYNISMDNETATLTGDIYTPGFPQVTVQLKRY